MTSKILIQQVLLKRGNTAVASTYTGPLGEVVVDTDLDALRVQDASTAGGHVIPTLGMVNDIVDSAIAEIPTNTLTNGDFSVTLESDGNVTIPGVIQSTTDSLVFQANSARPDLAWAISNYSSGEDSAVSALLAPVSDEHHIGELIFPGIEGAGGIAWVGDIDVPFPNSLVILSSGNIAITTDNGLWMFDSNGNLHLPQGGDIVDSDGNSVLGGGDTNRLVNGDSILSMLSDGTLTLTHPDEPAYHPLSTTLTIQKAAGNYHTISGAYGLSLQATPVPSGYGLNTNTNFVDIFHDGISVNVNDNTWGFSTDGSLVFPTADVSFEYFVPTLIGKDQISFATYDAENNANAYVISTQDNKTWEAFAEDDETGAHEAWAYIRAELPTIDTPTVFIQNRKGVDGINYDWVFDADGKLTAPGHIVPNADLAYDLGSTTTQWRSIYVGTGTIFIGGVALGVNQDNYVTVDGNPIITVNTAGNFTVQGDTNIVLGAVVISDTAPAATTPGSQWFNTVEARTYVAYNEQWVDASPTVLAPPDTNPTLESVTFNDATIQTTAWTGTYSYNNLTEKPVTPTFVGGGGASTWLTAN